MRLDSPGEAPEHLGLLLVPRFAMVALFSAIEPLRIANRLAGRTLFQWTLISEDGEPVVASNGMSLGVDTGVSDAPPCSSLAICASFAPEQAFRPVLLDWLTERARQGCALGGMDTGCFILAQAGLLNGQTVTLHWESLPDFRSRYPLVDAVESLFEVTPQGFSCAGGSSAIDMALSLVRRRHGNDLAQQVRDQLMHGRERLPASRQRPQHRPADPGLRRALALMENHLETPLSLRELAHQAGLSWRHLERLCDRHLNCSPRDHYQRLRLEQGHRLLLATNQPVLDIALTCGFASSSTFTRAFRRRYNLTPSRLRNQASH